MSEQKLVSPLLDGFQMGDPISSHDGVRCCPAIKENSDNKYIIKILSIPASQNQLEALLLTGAFQDAAGALNYFRELADGVVREAQLHQQLARLKGFVPCEGWQVVPMDNNQLGYDVYLLTPYRRTLERHLKKNTMTHLEAVNLGLDLCAALAACRRAGYIYVDLKPSNIFISDDKEYLIGDLGFISMDSMKYAALPSKYRSRYSAPELHDVFSTISPTTDIYALGLILYQVYNDGQLPFETQPPAEELAPPANADYEMAEIILKACHPDPAQRWQNPTDMGQALVAYMQRNTINDVPIMPPVISDSAGEVPVEEEIAQEPVAEEEVSGTSAEETGEVTAETAEEPAEVTAEADDAPAAEEDAPAEAPVEESPEEIPAEAESAVEEEMPAEEESAAEEDVTGEEEPAAEEDVTAEEEPAAPVEESAEADAETAVLGSVAQELASVYDMFSDEDILEEDVQDLGDTQVSEETSAMLAQAEELAALEIPGGVVVTAPKLPEEEPAPEVPDEEVSGEETNEEDEEDEDDGGEDEIDIPIAIPDLAPVKKKSKKWLAILAILVLLAGLAYGANYYYQNYYLVPMDVSIVDAGTNEITANVVTDFDESLLMAVCIDTYGNSVPAAVNDGVAHFTGLNPGTQYTVKVEIDGFNKPVGNVSASISTIQQTNIVSFSATTGAEDGSVILSFTVDGSDPGNWTVEYTAEGEEPQTMSFTGHMVTLTGLTVDSPYTFRLTPTEQTEVEVVGTDTLEFTAGKVILAENTAIDSFRDDVMTIRWNAPEGAQVSEWTVRCTDGGTYDQTLTVTDCAASFSGVTADTTYTLEILAQGMTQSARADVTPKLLTVTAVTCTPVDSATLRITWEYEGDVPAGGWTVTCTMDGGEAQTLTSETNAADLSPVIPGASYTVSVNGVETTYTAPAAGKFSGHGISASDLSYSTCVTPSGSSWNQNDVKQYATSFSADQSISLVVYSKSKVTTDNADVQILYLIRDEQGNLLTDLTAVQTMKWTDMWYQNHFCPTIPNVPDKAGTYTAEIYFDGALAISKQFKIN